MAAVFCTRGHPLLLNTVQINSSETAPLFTAHIGWQQTRRGYNEALTFVTSLENELKEKYCAFTKAKTFVLALRRNAYFSVSLLWFFQRPEQSSTQRGLADRSTMTEAHASEARLWKCFGDRSARESEPDSKRTLNFDPFAQSFHSMTRLTAAGWMAENESSKTGPESFREAATLVGGHCYGT